MLIAHFLAAAKLDPEKLDLLKQWALELKDIHHHKSGNYLLLFFEKLRDFNPRTAGYFVEMLAKKRCDGRGNLARMGTT